MKYKYEISIFTSSLNCSKKKLKNQNYETVKNTEINRLWWYTEYYEFHCICPIVEKYIFRFFSFV